MFFRKLATPSRLLLVLSILVNGFFWGHIKRVHEDLGVLEVSLANAVEANRANVSTIDELIGRVEMCVMEREVDEAANATTVAALRQELEALRAREPEIIRVREEIYRDPSCEELGRTDVAAVCPGIADSVRDYARALGSGGGS